jgi:hypothetical protein
MPSIKPAIMDSHGNPGTAGNVIGVETEAELVLAIVGVLTTVIVDTEVLTVVTVSGLVVATGSVEDEIISEVLPTSEASEAVELEVLCVAFCVVVVAAC